MIGKIKPILCCGFWLVMVTIVAQEKILSIPIDNAQFMMREDFAAVCSECALE